MQLVLAEDADFLVILGDFDYDDDPAAWHAQLHESDTWWATQYTSNVYRVNGVVVDESRGIELP
ncbi:MAG: hypothetical protein IAG13_17355 [Deltaproteobacteria bacterium]|nr:hypothetical protein [Nannocystaceae bacterium]